MARTVCRFVVYPCKTNPDGTVGFCGIWVCYRIPSGPPPIFAIRAAGWRPEDGAAPEGAEPIGISAHENVVELPLETLVEQLEQLGATVTFDEGNMQRVGPSMTLDEDHVQRFVVGTLPEHLWRTSSE